MTLLQDPEWGDRVLWSNRKLADHCVVPESYVRRLRRELETPKGENASVTQLPQDDSEIKGCAEAAATAGGFSAVCARGYAADPDV
jgi:hypothetical protein